MLRSPIRFPPPADSSLSSLASNLRRGGRRRRGDQQAAGGASNITRDRPPVVYLAPRATCCFRRQLSGAAGMLHSGLGIGMPRPGPTFPTDTSAGLQIQIRPHLESSPLSISPAHSIWARDFCSNKNLFSTFPTQSSSSWSSFCRNHLQRILFCFVCSLSESVESSSNKEPLRGRPSPVALGRGPREGDQPDGRRISSASRRWP